jgi:hypothetical protein
LLAPAAIASSAGIPAGASTAAGTAVTAAGTSAAAGMLTGALTGASIGGGIAQQFAGGDIAGGVTTAASAAQGIMQSMQDQKLYGYSPTSQERAGYLQQALKLNTNLRQVGLQSAQTGIPIPQLLQNMQIEQATMEELGGMFQDFGLTGEQAFEQGKSYPGGTPQLWQDLQGEGSKLAAKATGQKAYATSYQGLKAQVSFWGQQEKMEPHASQQEINEWDQRIEDIHELVQTGELSPEQGNQQLELLGPPPRRVQTQRRTPPTVQERIKRGFTVQQLAMPDGSLSRPILFRLGAPTPRSPEGDFYNDGWADEDGADQIKPMTDQQFAKVLNDEMDALYPGFSAFGKMPEGMTREQMEAAAYDSLLRKKRMRQRFYAPPAPARPEAPQQRGAGPIVGPPQKPQQPVQAPQQPVSPLARDADLLVRISMTAGKIEDWTPEQHRNALAVAARFQIELAETYGEPKNVPPELLPALRFALRILKGK